MQKKLVSFQTKTLKHVFELLKAYPVKKSTRQVKKTSKVLLGQFLTKSMNVVGLFRSQGSDRQKSHSPTGTESSVVVLKMKS